MKSWFYFSVYKEIYFILVIRTFALTFLVLRMFWSQRWKRSLLRRKMWSHEWRNGLKRSGLRLVLDQNTNASTMWRRCMEFKMKTLVGKLETYHIDRKTGTAYKVLWEKFFSKMHSRKYLTRLVENCEFITTKLVTTYKG